MQTQTQKRQKSCKTWHTKPPTTKKGQQTPTVFSRTEKPFLPWILSLRQWLKWSSPPSWTESELNVLKTTSKTFMRSEMCDFDYIHVFMVDTASNTQADASMHWEPSSIFFGGEKGFGFSDLMRFCFPSGPTHGRQRVEFEASMDHAWITSAASWIAPSITETSCNLIM